MTAKNHRFQPRVEALEDRCVPSWLSQGLSAIGIPLPLGPSFGQTSNPPSHLIVGFESGATLHFTNDTGKTQNFRVSFVDTRGRRWQFDFHNVRPGQTVNGNVSSTPL